MADQVIPPVEKSPEEIEREMASTRESITEKVAALENQVVGTVQTAADTISDTVAAVKSIVSAAPEAVTDTVKQATAAVSDAVKSTFDVTGHVRKHPWAAVGTSALLGSIVGWLTAGPRREFSPFAGASAPVPAAPASLVPPPRAADEKPGVVDEFMGMIGDRVRELARTALETVSGALKQNIETGVPKLVDDAASRLTNNGTVSDPAPFADRLGASRVRV